jgi:hypothetical protein
MAPDYDLSNLETAQVDLWVYLQGNFIFGQIMADQAKRLGFSLVLGDCIAPAMTEKPQAIFNTGKRGAGPWARLQKQN